MNDKTILARLKRKWQGQEKDRIIWNEGIIPNFITLDEIYNPTSFTCYQLYKILQDSFSYQNLYKYLKKYEMEKLLTSKSIINENNRKERIYSIFERSLNLGLYYNKYIQNNLEKVEAQKLFELIREYNHPKKIYNAYNKKKISKDYALDTLQDIINEGDDMFKKHQLESSFLLNSLKYIIKISKKDKSLFSFLESIVVSHEDSGLQEKAVDYIKRYFPKLFEINLSRYLEGKRFYTPNVKSLDDYILTNEMYSFYRLFRLSKDKLKELKDRKLLDFHILAQEKLKKYRNYMQILNYGDYDPLIKCLTYNWSHIRVAYKKIKNFEQEPYKIILSANLRNQGNKFWRLADRDFYFSLKIFNTVLNIKEKDIFVAFPFLHEFQDGGRRYKSPIKIFSEKTEFIVYLRR